MFKSIPVPWMRWRRFHIEGRVREQETGQPVKGLMVCAFDKDVVWDDYLGEAETDADGHFEIHFTDADFKDFGETHPDLYLRVFRPGNRDPVHDTSYEIRENAEEREYFEIVIPRGSLDAHRAD